jgi:NADH:ubiquinone oxidoreductase subunit 5 (subunit L)/multisubunit Na+/H+ antiporter MnhA subunit
MDIYEIKKDFVVLIMTAFALVVGFFWYDAIKEMLLPISEGATGWLGLTIVAVVITFIAIGVAWIFDKFFTREKTECEKQNGVWKDTECNYREK